MDIHCIVLLPLVKCIFEVLVQASERGGRWTHVLHRQMAGRLSISLMLRKLKMRSKKDKSKDQFSNFLWLLPTKYHSAAEPQIQLMGKLSAGNFYTNSSEIATWTSRTRHEDAMTLTHEVTERQLIASWGAFQACCLLTLFLKLGFTYPLDTGRGAVFLSSRQSGHWPGAIVSCFQYVPACLNA